jgi:carbon-monoxide dehydrogenase large subunit
MEKFGIGQSVRRIEDERLLRGEACFGDDLRCEGMLHLALLRSPHAHADITAIDTAVARAMAGVVAVLTGADLAAEGIGALPSPPRTSRADGKPSEGPPRFALARSRVRFVGEAVAAVLAETQAEAEDAAERIAVEYEPLPAIVGVDEASAPDALLLCPEAPGNVAAFARFGDAAATDAAFARAAHAVRLRIVNNRVVPNALEPRATLAEYDPASERFTLRTVSQTPTTLRQQLADGVLRLPKEQIRVLVPDIGGGFGLKTNLHPEDAVAAIAARRFGRPVKWRATRADEFLAGTHGRDQVSDAALAFDGDGRILGLRVRTKSDLGAYLTPAGAVVALLLGPRVVAGCYRISAVDLEVGCYLTNTGPTAPYRGAGRPEAIYVVERLIEEAAVTIGLDPVEIRRRNFVPPDAFPYPTPTGDIYDCGEFERVLDRALASADWQGFAARRDRSAKAGLLRGRGLSSFIEWTGAAVYTEQAIVRIQGDGRVTLQTAMQAMGQGLGTCFAQLLATALDLPIDCIEILPGDTDAANGIGSVASRSLFIGGPATMAGGKAALDKAQALAADSLEAAPGDIEYRAGIFSVAGTDRRIGLFELAQRQPDARIEVDLHHTIDAASWPNGCHVAEVEIDPETGAVRVVRYTAVDDLGTVVNPMIVEGQAHGSLAQGIGQVLLERTVYDQSGQLQTASFLDYAMPRADDLPAFRIETEPGIPSPGNALGAKGAGELGCVAAPPAIMAAILDALRPFGVRDLDMPATPERVWRAIEEARASRSAAPQHKVSTGR